MRLFDPELRPEDIRSRQRRICNAWFRPGECLRLIYDVLRDAPEPVTTRELAKRLTDVKHIEIDDDRGRALIQKTILASLNRAKDTIERMRPRAWSPGGCVRRRVRVASSHRIDRWLALHRQANNAVHLLAVADAAVVLSPACFLGIAAEIPPGDMVVMPQLAAAQTREEGLAPIGAGAIDALPFFMVYSSHREPGVQLVPGRALIGMQHGALGDPLADHRHGGLLAWDHLHQSAPLALAHHDDDLAFARLVLGEPPVDPIDGQVFRPDVATEIGAVDLGHPSFAADAQRFTLDAIASRSLCASTKDVLYWTSSSRLKASMLLPFTSLQKAATASR